MNSKQPWLVEALRRGLEVMIYNGNLDVIVNIPGTNKVVNSLQWSGRGEFVKSKRKDFWVYNERSDQPELAGKLEILDFLARKLKFLNFSVCQRGRWVDVRDRPERRSHGSHLATFVGLEASDAIYALSCVQKVAKTCSIEHSSWRRKVLQLPLE